MSHLIVELGPSLIRGLAGWFWLLGLGFRSVGRWWVPFFFFVPLSLSLSLFSFFRLFLGGRVGREGVILKQTVVVGGKLFG